MFKIPQSTQNQRFTRFRFFAPSHTLPGVSFWIIWKIVIRFQTGFSKSSLAMPHPSFFRFFLPFCFIFPIIYQNRRKLRDFPEFYPILPKEIEAVQKNKKGWKPSSVRYVCIVYCVLCIVHHSYIFWAESAYLTGKCVIPKFRMVYPANL